MKKRITAALVMFALFAVSAYAANAYQNITVQYGISLSVNGQYAALTDGAGRSVQPFTYNGTTYVPIRAVSEALGAGVWYDDQSNTAHIVDDYYFITDVIHMIQETNSDMFINGLNMQQDFAKNSFNKSYVSGRLESFQGQYTAIAGYLDSLSQMGNGYLEYLNEGILENFTDHYKSYVKMAESYIKYCDTNSVMYAQGALTYFDDNIDYYYDCKEAINSFYN